MSSLKNLTLTLIERLVHYAFRTMRPFKQLLQNAWPMLNTYLGKKCRDYKKDIFQKIEIEYQIIA